MTVFRSVKAGIEPGAVEIDAVEVYEGAGELERVGADGGADRRDA